MRIDLGRITADEFAAYRDECDLRSSAEFRMRREMCGIRTEELAEAIGVRLDTVKRMENPSKGNGPSLKAWAYVDSAYMDLLDAVEAAVEQVEDLAEEFGEPRSVRVAYRRIGMPTRDGESVGAANAATRAAAIALITLGYSVEAEWADGSAAAILAE